MTTGQVVRAVQLTDTHLYGVTGRRMLGVNTHQTLTDVVEMIIEEGTPDLVLLTGDVSQDETPQSYRHVYDIIKRIDAPVYYLPGNHDLPRTMYEQYTDERVPFKAARSACAGDWVFVMLDTTIEGHTEGALSPQELERLDRELTLHKGKNAMVCLHHNPFSIGPGAFNEYGCTNGAEFFDVIDKHQNVRAVISGHVHQEFDSQRNNVRLLTTPSTCLQFLPLAEKFTLDAKPPGYRRFTLYTDGNFATSVHRLAQVPEGLDVTLTVGKQ